jgi:hypothetical protein
VDEPSDKAMTLAPTPVLTLHARSTRFFAGNL